MHLKRVIFFTLVLLIEASYASALIGVTPSRFEIDFKPGLKQVFSIHFFGDGIDNLEAYVEGDLAEYVQLSTKSLKSTGGTVNVLLELPEEIEIPGEHNIYIGIRQIPSDRGGIRIVGAMRATIKIKVPYPGQYASIGMEALNARAGESVNFTVRIENLGDEAITTNTGLVVRNFANKTMATIPLGVETLQTQTTTSYTAQWKTKTEDAGRYSAEANVLYGDNHIAKVGSSFRVGELFVNITNYTEELARKKINRFDVWIESFWNDPIDNVYVKVSFVNSSYKTLDFQTPSTTLNGFSTILLTSYFDTAPIQEDKFLVNISVHYADRTTARIVKMRFTPETDYLVYILVGIVLLLILAIIVLVAWIRIKKKKNEKQKN